MAYELYPAVDEVYNFPPEIRNALAISPQLRNTVIPMTTALRNSLTSGELWDGRTIANTTTDHLERYDAGTSLWRQVSEAADISTALSTRAGRNRILNGDFSVNQRSVTSTTTNTEFGHDHWKLYYVGGTTTYSAVSPPFAGAALPEQPRSCVTLSTTGQSLATHYAMITQGIESVRTLSGKTVTVSFWAKALSGTPKIGVQFDQYFGLSGGSSTVFIPAGTVTLATSWAKYSVTVTLPTLAGKTIGTGGDDALWVDLVVSAGTSAGTTLSQGIGLQNNSFDIWGVQVEEGSTATIFDQRTYAEELQACKRFFYRRIMGVHLAKVGMGVVTATTQALIAFPLPVQMRISPEVSFSGNWQAYDGSAVASVTTIVKDTTDAQFAGLLVTTAAGLTVGRAVYLHSPVGSHIDFNAEY